MARTGRPKVELVLTEDEREQLTRWSRRAKSSQALALRSRIVLACADGVDNKTVAARVGCAAGTVGKWRARFVELRLDGLLDEPRPGRPPVIGVDQVEDVVVATLESTPANATHWSRAKMADRSSTSTSRSGRPSSPATSASRSPASTPRWPPRRPRPGPRRSRAGDPGAAHPGARRGGARRTAPASTIRERNANACDDFARRDHRVSCSRSSSVNTSSTFGRPVLAIPESITYPDNFRCTTLARIKPSTVQGWVSHAVELGLSPRSIAKYHTMLHSVFARAVRDRMLAFNPC